MLGNPELAQNPTASVVGTLRDSSGALAPAVSQTVSVVAEAPLLNTESGVRGDVIVTQEIVEMPLDRRSGPGRHRLRL